MSIFKQYTRIKKVASGGLIIAILVPFLFLSAPKKTYAFLGIGDVVIDVITEIEATATAIWGGITAAASAINSALTGSLVAKEFIGDGVANFIAKLIIKQLTAQTVNWINSGFKGNPAFVTNPQQFFLNVGDQVASTYLSSNSVLNKLCTPFNVRVRLALVKNYLYDQNNYSCTISKVVQNYDSFTRDFSQGGWDGWFAMTQSDMSNPIGAYVNGREQLYIQVAGKQKTYGDQLNQGKGFLSWQKCPTGKDVTKIVGSPDGKAMTVTYGDGVTIKQDFDPDLEVGGCGTDTETATPGSVISEQLNTALGSTWGSLVSADEINEIVGALATQLVSRVVGGIGNGLRGLSQKQTGESRSFLEQLAASSPESQKENIDFKNQIDATTPPELTGGGAASPNNPTLNPAPKINLNGDNPLTINQGATFVDPGYIAIDAKEGDISSQVIVSGVVDISTPGTYTLTYSVANSAGISANSVTRTVIVTQAAVIPTSTSTPVSDNGPTATQ